MGWVPGPPQPPSDVMPSTRKGAELQSLGVLLTELGDIGFPEPDSRAPEWSIRPNPSDPRGRGSWRDGKSSTSRIPPAVGPWVYHYPLWAPIFLHKLVGQAKKMKPPRANLSFPGSSEPPGASIPAQKEEQQDKRASPASLVRTPSPPQLSPT